MQKFNPSSTNNASIASTLNGEVKLSAKVLVNIGGKLALKPKELLCIGDGLLLPKGIISPITLDMADEAFRKSNNRYVLSQHDLFEQYNGRNYTVFQRALFTGMAQKQELWPEPIARDPNITVNFAAGQPIQLDCAQKEAAASFIHSILAEKNILNPRTGQPITSEHIENGWLGGTVVAPHHYKTIAEALLEIAPNMEKLISSEFHEAYHKYLAIRHKAVKRANDVLSAAKQPGTNSSNHAHHANHNGNGQTIHVDAEVEYLVNYFYPRVTEHFLITPVIDIKTQHKNGAPAKKAGKPIVLEDIPLESLAADNLQLKPKAEIAREFYLLDSVASGLVNRFITDNAELIPPDARKNDASIQKFLFNLESELLEHLGFGEIDLAVEAQNAMKLDQSTISCMYFYTIGENKAVVQAAKFLAGRILDYSLDEHYGLPKGEILRLFEEKNKRRVMIPNNVIYAKVLADTRRMKQERYEADKKEFERNKKLGLDKRKGIPVLSFKDEDKELEKLNRALEVREMLPQFTGPFKEFGEANALLRQTGFEGIAQNSGFLYVFAFDPGQTPEPNIKSVIYSK